MGTVPDFTMQVESIFDSGDGVMVAGPSQGILPGAGDEVEIVRADQIQKVIVSAHTTLGSRSAFTLGGIHASEIKVGDVLQFRMKKLYEQLETNVSGEKVWYLVGPSSLVLDSTDDIVALGEVAIPVLIDLFADPVNRYGDSGTANQAQLASALVQFAEQGNQQAAAFLNDIAAGKYSVFDIFGKTALSLAREFTNRSSQAKQSQEVYKEQALKSILAAGIGTAADQAKVETESREKTLYASFWQRALAFSIDLSIILLLPMVVLMPLAGPEGMVKGFGEDLLGLAYLMWVVIAPLLVITLPLRLWGGQTFGKLILKILVIDQGGRRLSWGQCIGRTLLYLLSFYPLGLGFFWSIWDKQKRCFHDMIVHTCVIRKGAG